MLTSEHDPCRRFQVQRKGTIEGHHPPPQHSHLTGRQPRMAPHVLPRGAPARTRARRRDAERAPGPNEQAASLARSPRLGHGSACLQWRVGSRPRECRVLIRRLRAAIQALASSQEDCLQHITSPQGLPRLYQALESSQPGTGLVPVGCGQLHLDVRGSHVVPGIHRGAQLCGWQARASNP